MNTATVANLLGISQSTLKRWIKELDLDMNRNELGHYEFHDEDIPVLKQIQKQIQNGTFLQDVTVSRNNVRKGKTAILPKGTTEDALLRRINELEKRLNGKADNVVSYQLLTHRKEIEDLENEIKQLNFKIRLLEEKLEETKAKEIFNSSGNTPKMKKRKLFSVLFNF